MEIILNLLPLTDSERAAFLAAAPNEDHIFCPTDHLTWSACSASLDKLARATVILGCVPPHMLVRNTSLKWLQAWFAGVDPYLAPGIFPQRAMLTSAVGAYGQAVSEHMFASLMAVLKRLPQYRDNQRAHLWRDEGKVRTLAGATVLLLGTGDLGCHFAGLVKAMGARTVGFNRHPEHPADHVDELHPISELDQWLPLADVVAMTLPAAPETNHIIDARRLALLKKDAVLLNAGRGNAVDGYALAEALRSGALWGAALDVTEPEPLPAGHPLWDCPNLILTPHVAGSEHLDQTLRNIAALSLDNLKRYLAGEPLKNRVL
ncbi:MAG: D-2-hydroxyacid dehydrogenase [Clostridiales bacterium]|nr:D-2-hydroxyacid dehydrogenase [Clostridiales bacterium]